MKAGRLLRGLKAEERRQAEEGEDLAAERRQKEPGSVIGAFIFCLLQKRDLELLLDAWIRARP